jgi:hypothetical protein
MNRSRSNFKSYRLLLSLLIVFLIACSVFSQRRVPVEMSAIIQPSSEAPFYFSRHGRLGGGVVPRGSAEFIGPKNAVLSVNDLQLVVLDKNKLRNNRTDYDAIGIRYKENVYEISMPDDLVDPLMRFIQRGSFIIYTVPVAGGDSDYFAQQSLMKFRNVPRLGMGYVAKEFLGTPYAALLEATDFAKTQRLDRKLENQIVSRSIAGLGRGDFTGIGSYVNADFHVKYRVFLVTNRGKRVANVGGLPLRYHWRAANRGRAVKVYKVEAFTFPTEPFGLQDRSVMFFQTTAILRQFHNANRTEFNSFLREVRSLTK